MSAFAIILLPAASDGSVGEPSLFPPELQFCAAFLLQTFLHLLCIIGCLADPLHFLRIGLLVPVRDEGIILVDMRIPLTRVPRAPKAILRLAVLQTASGNRAGLIPESAAAAMPGEIH